MDLTVKIPLTQGKFTLIDNKDYPLVSQYKWHVRTGSRPRSCSRILQYAASHLPISNKIILLHRLILNPRKGEECDHINGDGLDNRRQNLRLVTHSENMMSQRNRLDTSSMYKGVCKCKDCNRWRAYIHINKKTIHLGSFKSEEEAGKAYDEAAKKYFGKYAKTNFMS